MGKVLVVKNANFALNAINEEPTPANIYTPIVVQQSGNSDFFLKSDSKWTFTDDFNELSGKIITGFDLIFNNYANDQSISTIITLPNSVTVEATCVFNGEDYRIIHIDLQEPYTFGDNSQILITTPAAPLVPNTDRSGIACYRIDRVDKIPNAAFLIALGSAVLPSYSFMPFHRIYLQI